MANSIQLKYAVKGLAGADRLRAWMVRAGRSPSGPLWTREEDAIVRSLYPDYAMLRTKLRSRSPHAIMHRVSKLGISRKCHFWTAAEVSRLRRLYPHKSFDELKLAFPGSNKMRLRKKANSLGITKTRKPFAPSGVEVIDSIRARAFELRLTMVDVDEMARTGIYFSRSQWRGHALNGRKILRAIEALDGEIAVKWR